MPMIQGIDSGVLLNALRTGRQDRMIYDEMQAKREADRLAAERQKQIGGLMGQLFEKPQGLAAQVVPPQTFEEAFSPQAMDNIASGAPAAAPVPSSPTVEPPRRRPNPQVLAQLVALDPETGGKIVGTLKTMDEMGIKALETKNAVLGAAAQYLASYPVEQRAALLRNLLPQLAEAGWTPQEIDGANLSDEGLQGYIALSMDTDTIIDNELAEREFQQGKILTPQPGEGAFRLRPDGTVETLVAPNPGGMPAGEAVDDIPQEAIEALRRGEGSPEAFDEYYGEGAAERVMGGAGGNAGGGF